MHNQKQLEVTTPTEHKFCLRCGRQLKSEEARKRGMGLVCWNKSHINEIQKPLFEIKNNH